MAKELFRAVQTAENQADQRIQEAQKSARELLKVTETEIVENERKIALEHRAMYQSIMEEKRVVFSAALSSNEAVQQAALAEKLQQARTHLDASAQRIEERVWTDGNR